MSSYFLINILTVVVPLILSFEKNLKFYKNIIPLSLSIFLIGGSYIIWDEIATIREDWAFNDSHIFGFKVFSLPLEEILFFITVPYSLIFLYETGKFYIKDKHININKWVFISLGIIFIISGLYWIDQYYTTTVMFFSSAFIFLSILLYPQIFSSRLYFQYISFSFIPFFIVNYFLTSIPIVIYNPDAIWGIRVTTIPLEDFFYSFSMNSLFLLFYLLFKNKWLKTDK